MVEISLSSVVVGSVETPLRAAGDGIAPWDESRPDASEGWKVR
jgi:hypothetical protein